MGSMATGNSLVRMCLKSLRLLLDYLMILDEHLSRCLNRQSALRGNIVWQIGIALSEFCVSQIVLILKNCRLESCS